MSPGYLYSCPPSAYNPTAPQLEYEVLHFQNHGQDQISSTKIGAFATLEDAQHTAQVALRAALDHYLARGWSGYYCNDIDLQTRGLITGLVSEQAYKCLSEICIFARESTQTNEQWNLASQYMDTVFSNISHHNRPRAAVRLPPLTQEVPADFSQTRPPYPNRPDLVVLRSNAQYDQVMSFKPRRSASTTAGGVANPERPQQPSKPKRHGNTLGGGYDIGAPYLGRRHSSFELMRNKSGFNTILWSDAEKH
ncbi:hypothetical protein EJ07DRAFT_159561 [Lizonia empirigonia]|nr:hypothetical protein EJ07DRAFT_159561 [Lizonia empirigonia]